MRRPGTSRSGNAAARDRERRFLRNLLWIAVAALLLRLGVSAELAAINGGNNSVFSPSKLSDLATYMQLARDMAAFRYSGEFYYQPFYYAVFLPLLYLVSGASVWFVIAVQSLLGAGCCWFAGLAAARIFGRMAGYAAAVLTAISTPLLLYTPFHQNETLQSFNLALLFYLVLRAMEWKRLRFWGWAGLMAGVAILTRGNIWILIPGILLLGGLAGRRSTASWRRVIAGLGFFAGVLIAVQLPFAVHNTRVTGRLSGPSTAADAVLGLGNSQEAPPGGREPGLPAGPMEYPEAWHRMMELSRSGVSVAEQMFDWMCREPAAFFELQFRKLLLFWDYREIPNNVSLYGEGEASRILQLLVFGRSGLLLALALAGILVAVLPRLRFRRSLSEWLLLYFIAAYWGATALFYILSRFRAPILPLAAVAGGAFVGWMIRRWKSAPAARRHTLLLGGGALVAAFWLTTSGYEFYRQECEAAVMRHVRSAGTRIDLGGGKSAWFDYGPLTFGGWQELPLEPGATLGKRFPVSAPRAELEWTLLSATPGRIAVKVNGEERILDLEQPGFSRVRIPVACPDGRIQIDILAVRGEQHLVRDLQRNYHRSELNGRTLDGEWIMRLYPAPEEGNPPRRQSGRLPGNCVQPVEKKLGNAILYHFRY